MGIFTRFKDIITSNISSMLDSAEDPDKLIKLMLREMEETLVELKAGCAATMAEASQTRRRLGAAETDSTQWNHRAELAIQAGREELAREAISARLQAEERVQALGREMDGFDTLITTCREDIRLLEERIVGTRDRQRLMTERHSLSRTRTQARSHVRAADALGTMRRFDELEQRITRMEHEAELAYTPPAQDAFVDLEREAEISAALDDLKTRMHPQADPAGKTAQAEMTGTPHRPDNA